MSDQDEQDLQCMERLREGDDLALNDLMTRWKEPLVTFCLRYTGNLSDARDIAQETFVKVYGERARYKPKAGAQFSTWLFTIATNLCRMRARWRSRHPEVLDADSEADVAEREDASDPRDETDRRALGRDLARAIAALPHDLRVALVLHEINGQRYREIAGVLKCSEKAVERRLARAREKLRAELEEKWRGSLK
ncbi:MAG: RNA polymerase sigma factor (sigma-70 family) [Pseudoalteromonas tetraodonis]|jgi:RNA polymerase sigma factor (sigma-70 family)